MGCRHCFVVDRVAELVDEGGSRSASLAHEHESFRLVSQQNVAIRILWSHCQPRLNIERSDCGQRTCFFLKKIQWYTIGARKVGSITKKLMDHGRVTWRHNTETGWKKKKAQHDIGVQLLVEQPPWSSSWVEPTPSIPSSRAPQDLGRGLCHATTRHSRTTLRMSTAHSMM